MVTEQVSLVKVRGQQGHDCFRIENTKLSSLAVKRGFIIDLQLRKEKGTPALSAESWRHFRGWWR